MNDNINVDSTMAGSMNGNINVDSTMAGIDPAIVLSTFMLPFSVVIVCDLIE
jgi:hypothetical protein